MSNNRNKINKYRPSLTKDSIIDIIDTYQAKVPMSSKSIQVLTSLVPFLAKIEVSGVNAAYTSNPISIKKEESIIIGKEETWARSYDRYINFPESCTDEDIQEAKEHMYLNDLMSLKEKEEFESQLSLEVESNDQD